MSARKFLEVLVAAVLLTGLLAADGVAAEDPLEGFYVAPSLQISPELADVRPGVPVELTARLSHPVMVDTPVHFQLESIASRAKYGRRKAPPAERPECMIPAGDLTCAITVVRHQGAALIIRGWLGGDQPSPPDTREGRLASLNLFFHPGADCRLEDGEPVDDSCRGGLNSHVEPGAPEPDGTDVVLVGWTGTAAAFVDCDDPGTDGDTEVEVRPPDQRTVTYVCALTNRVTGQPIVGAHLAGEVMGGRFDDERNGAFRSDYGAYPYHHEDRRLCTTSAPSGHCSFDLTVPGDSPGKMTLCLWSDGDNDGLYGPDDDDGGGCADEAFDEQPEANDGFDTVVIRLE
ncbi:MAG: hypothetical protein M3357_11035 [Actinomycetota bacterium]|nr:hypothetical protein [Actinomycetota bacterium]